MKRRHQKVVFLTGTDTGVGKTIATIALLRWLRGRGESAIALKPFCSGDREDAKRLALEVNGEMALEQINPFYTRAPIAPGAVRPGCKRAPSVSANEVVAKISEASRGYDWVLVEGIGGVLVPLAKGLFVSDIIAALKAPAIVVSRDALGTLNHSLLTVRELERRRIRVISLWLMKFFSRDASANSNAVTLAQLLPQVEVARFPKLAAWPELKVSKPALERIFKKTLAQF